ncbi:uncharacterized protein L3040_009121 [Drepanopeziza brunnea f. sp. 'multigermtubi']|uniref:uncharacterized protein n=1 Tax=Drepanopeziza brunnea f. sp. 'multigermtubi' TaxID=698441 RepID=UPI00238F31A0|nr:hypothetical protein L3040_009121 [Drepanopeziza brunnea f. sp. 'multigermtubi']
MSGTSLSAGEKASKSRASSNKNSRKNSKTGLPCFSDPKSLVTFIVGPDPDPVEFLVHKEIICHHSKVFKAAFNGTFLEGQTQTYRLQDTTQGAFRLLTQWIYFQKLNIPQIPPGSVVDEDDEALAGEGEAALAELYVLADKFAMAPLQNAVIDEIENIGLVTRNIPVDIFNYIYENTSPGSALRRYVVMIATSFELGPEISESNHPYEMTIEMCREFISQRASKRIKKIKISDFYVKLDDE